MIEFEKKLPQKRWLDLAPMIDVVFLLLIFFMLTSIYAKPMIPVSLPESETSIVQDEPEITIGISSNGSLSLNRKNITLDQLHDQLSQLLHECDEKNIRLIADKRIHFGLVISVMDIAKQAGADNIAVVTEKKQRHEQ